LLNVAARERPLSEPARKALRALSSKRMALSQRGCSGAFRKNRIRREASPRPPMAAPSSVPTRRYPAGQPEDRSTRSPAVAAGAATARIRAQLTARGPAARRSLLGSMGPFIYREA